MHNATRAVAGTIISALLCGCSSYGAQHLVVGPDGEVIKGERFDGVPMTITVAEKLAFLVTESTYLVTTPVLAADGTSPSVQTRQTRTTISPTPIALGRTELFTLDAMRPASGSGHSSFQFNDRQSPDLISNEVTDTTLKDILENLDKVKDTFAEQATQAGAVPGSTEILLSQSQYFVVYDPETGRLQKFL